MSATTLLIVIVLFILFFGGGGYYCSGMRVVPALTDCQAQILAQETLALIKMHREATNG